MPLLQEDRRLDRHDNLPVCLAKDLERLAGLVQWELVDSRGFQLSSSCKLRQCFQSFGIHLRLDIDSLHAALRELVARCRPFHRNDGSAVAHYRTQRRK